MVDRIVDEITKCLKSKCYIAALTSAIILPDVCGKAEFSNEKNNKIRYSRWCEEYLIKNTPFSLVMPVDMLYKLRCNLLHEGNPTVGKDAQVEEFALLIQGNSANQVLEDTCEVVSQNGDKKMLIYNINLIFLCNKICEAALQYYNNYKDKFNFFDYRINIMSDQDAKSFGIKEDLKYI